MSRRIRTQRKKTARTPEHGGIQDTHQYQDELRYLQTITNSVSDAIISTDLKFKILSWNHGAEKTYGYTAKEAVGKNAPMLLPTRYVVGNREDLLAYIQKIGHWEGEVLQRKKNGEEIRIHSVISAVKDDKKKIIGYVSVNRDITERMLHEDVIRASEERYRAFVSQSTEGIWRFELEEPVSTSWSVKKQIDHFYKYAYLAECNDAMAKMYGFQSARDLIGARMAQFLPRSKQNIQYLTAFIKSGYKLTDAESHEIDRYGNTKYFLNNLIGIFHKGGSQRAWGTQRDITEYKKAEALLKESEARFRLMADSAPVMIWMADTENKGTYFNKQWLEFTGKKLEQELGYGWADAVHPDDKPGCVAYCQEHFNKREPFIMEFRMKNKKGEYHWVRDHGVPLFDPDGKFTGYIGSCIVIHDKKVAEQQKDEFIGIASHELKTPVTSLKVYLQALQKVVAMRKDDAMADHLRKMDVQLDKMTKLILDLLDLSKIQAGKLELNKKKFKIDDLVKETADTLQAVYHTHLIMLDGQTKKTVFGNRDRLGQVLVNLIANAVKYSPKADRVLISSRALNGKVVISVRDYGIGISEKDQKHVFDRFFRVEGNKEKTFTGFGMGLYIAAEIVRRHGGDIWVESARGKGSMFSFSLPVKRGE